MREMLVLILLLNSAVAQVTIQDIQTSTNGASPLVGQQVTVQGVVTASGQPGDLGSVFIQQENANEWAGIRITGHPLIYGLKRGDLVEVEGVVMENSGLTVVDVWVPYTVLDSNIAIDPIVLEPEFFTSYDVIDTEKYESMLIEFSHLTDSVVVVDQNPDLPNNFGDYRLGASLLMPDDGCRVLAGRVTSTEFSSLNVSYVNDSTWINNSGSMNVPALIVQEGDAFQSVRGIMAYGFGDMRLLPRNNDDFVMLNVAVEENTPIGFEIGLHAYPNPAKGLVWVEGGFSDITQVSLVGIDGRTVDNDGSIWTLLDDGRMMLNTTGLAAGLYILSIVDKEYFRSTKLRVDRAY